MQGLGASSDWLLRLSLVVTLLISVSWTGDVFASGPCVTAQVVGVGGSSTVLRTPCAAAAGPVAPPPIGIVNGSFDVDLEGWDALESGGSIIPGQVTVDSQQALFVEGDSFLVTLQQTFAVPAFASTLTFDLVVDPGFDLGSSFAPDAFEVSLLDNDLLPLIEPWFFGASSFFNMQEDGQVNLSPQMSDDPLPTPVVTWNGTTVTVILTGVSDGTVATLYVDLVNADFDTLSGVRVDNFAIAVDPPPGTFVRGDVDEDGSVTVGDETPLLDLLFAGSALPLDCSGAALLEVADANDNEWVTIADYLTVRSANVAGSTLPEPGVGCGFDPDDDVAGFDVVDPSFRLAAGEVFIDDSAGPTDRKVFLPVSVDVATAITGFTVVLEYDPTLVTPFDPIVDPQDPFTPTAGTSSYLVEPGRLLVAAWSTNDGELLFDADPGVFQLVGEIAFNLVDGAVFQIAGWNSETSLGGLTYRATIVDGSFTDHHPELLAGDGQFARGDANNDSSVDIADPVFTLDYLFVAGPNFACFDAADANNDGQVNIADAIYTLSFLFVPGSPPPPTPYPGCGEDVGNFDQLDCQGSTCN